MHFHFRNVNFAFRGLLEAIEYPRNVPQGLVTRHVSSRAGDVKMVDEPVLVTFTNPLERVLFNQSRDANPFFHLFESLWMLAGRNDVAPLLKYNSKIGDVASDDGQTFNGAYGYRWRNHRSDISSPILNIALRGPHYTKTTDQLKIVIDQLKRKPESRRVVLQMWNVEDDLLKIDETKDVCCNTNAYFSVRQYGPESSVACVKPGYLDMTVCNRSNDLIWGMLGANVVHFSFLQEYLAACIGVSVGVYNQFTNNLHVYIERYKPEEWLADQTPIKYESNWASIPLVQYQDVFDQEVVEFIDNQDWTRNWKEPFLDKVAAPMCWAFDLHKRREYSSALSAIDLVAADDWRIAGYNWIKRRQIAWEKNHVSSSEE
jgi:thymidylate synthase